jgi:hypothetical protein
MQTQGMSNSFNNDLYSQSIPDSNMHSSVAGPSTSTFSPPVPADIYEAQASGSYVCQECGKVYDKAHTLRLVCFLIHTSC